MKNNPQEQGPEQERRLFTDESANDTRGEGRLRKIAVRVGATAAAVGLVSVLGQGINERVGESEVSPIEFDNTGADGESHIAPESTPGGIEVSTGEIAPGASVVYPDNGEPNPAYNSSLDSSEGVGEPADPPIKHESRSDNVYSGDGAPNPAYDPTVEPTINN